MGNPKLSQYLGQGPLEHWVTVVAIRVAVSMGRAETAEMRLRQKAAADATGAGNAELQLMKHELRAELEAAVGEALARLPDRERLVLRLYLVSGMTLEAIGKTFDVTHSTVSRWLTHARESMLADVQSSLGERLKVANADLASFARMVMSRARHQRLAHTRRGVAQSGRRQRASDRVGSSSQVDPRKAGQSTERRAPA